MTPPAPPGEDEDGEEAAFAGMVGRRPPAQVAPFVDALGEAQAIRFFLSFGGAELYVPVTPTPRGRLVAVLGHEGAAVLARARDHLPRRVPLAKPWIARVLRAQGVSVAEIARTLLTPHYSPERLPDMVEAD